jgi:hypothetical protein
MLTGRGGIAAAGLTLALAFAGCAREAPTAVNDAPSLAKGGRAGPIGTVYVRSQGLYYDTFVSAERLPMRGRFQLLEDGETDFGPGDPGYLGGRWWVDANGNGIQDADDTFLLCPLLPPGRTTP